MWDLRSYFTYVRITSLDRIVEVMGNGMSTPEQHAKNNRKTLSLLGTVLYQIFLITPGDPAKAFLPICNNLSNLITSASNIPVINCFWLIPLNIISLSIFIVCIIHLYLTVNTEFFFTYTCPDLINLSMYYLHIYLYPLYPFPRPPPDFHKDH